MFLELIPDARMARYINDHGLLLVRKGEDRSISLKRCVRWQILRVDQLFHYKRMVIRCIRLLQTLEKIAVFPASGGPRRSNAFFREPDFVLLKKKRTMWCLILAV